LTDRARAAEDECWRVRQVQVPGGGPHRGGRRGVRAVGVEHARHLQAVLRDHRLANLGEHLFAGSHVRAAHEDRGAVQVLRPAGEDAALDEVADLLRRDAAVGEDVFGPRVHGHDAVEDARLRVGVELEEDGRLVAHDGLG
jgi:hypothetical protein